MKNKGAFISIIIAALFGIGAIVMYYSYDNKYIGLITDYEAQVSENKIIYDGVWKTVKQQADITEQYAENFERIYVKLMDERYESGGEAFKWIKEQNPEFSPEMYQTLMRTIAVERAKFTSVQRKLITVHQEIKNLVQLFPSRVFVGGRPVPELKLVTSTKTENTFSTGKEDDVDLFKK